MNKSVCLRGLLAPHLLHNLMTSRDKLIGCLFEGICHDLLAGSIGHLAICAGRRRDVCGRSGFRLCIRGRQRLRCWVGAHQRAACCETVATAVPTIS